MKNEPILSIIIPSYNTSAYIDECLPFFINEKLFGKVVIYLIDDGATDDTAEKISRYTKLYPYYFKFVHKENGGHGSVINYAVYNLIQSKYFKVIDGDDWVDTNNLIEFVDFLENNDSDLIVSDYDKVYQNKIEQVKCYVPNSDYFKNLLTTIHSLTYKTTIYKNNKILLTEKCFYEDNQFVLYPLRYVTSVDYFSKTIYKYRLGNVEQSVSLSSMLKRFDDYEIIRNEIFNKCSGRQQSEKSGSTCVL